MQIIMYVVSYVVSYNCGNKLNKITTPQCTTKPLSRELLEFSKHITIMYGELCD